MSSPVQCAEPAPGAGQTGRCQRPTGHPGIHVVYSIFDRQPRETDTWPRWQDVVDLKRRNGVL